jgi:thymidylate kinase
MRPKVYIGLEAHDGSGKSSTAMRIAEMFGGRVFFTSQDMKERRRAIYSTTPPEEQEASIHQTYLDEQEDCVSQTANSSFIVLDRTWYSHAVEQNVRDVLDHDNQPTFVPRDMPEDLHKPNLVFQILIPEEERKRRVASRGEELTGRDVRLNDDDEYRDSLEGERKKFGCVPLRLRLRDQQTCALRAAQVILGHPEVPPLRISPNYSFTEHRS